MIANSAGTTVCAYARALDDAKISVRALGTLLTLAWGLQLLSIGLPTFLSISAEGVPANAWWFLALHVLIACIGAVGGVLALRRAAIWKWFALVSGVTFLAVFDFAWYSTAERVGGVAVFLLHFPRIGYSTLVMPVFALVFALVAGWKALLDYRATRSNASRGN